MLAVFGVFGIVSFAVAQRKKEVAIRVALGARSTDIFRTAMGFGLRPLPMGILMGVVLSWAGLKVAESQRIVPLGLVSRDPIPYIVVGALLLLTALAAMLWPAYRATTSDPVNTLRRRLRLLRLCIIRQRLPEQPVSGDDD